MRQVYSNTAYQRYVIEMVAENDLPFSFVQSRTFRKVVEMAAKSAVGVPHMSDKTARERMMKAAGETIEKLESDLKVSLSTDIIVPLS
jgi:hypothetical protein